MPTAPRASFGGAATSFSQRSGTSSFGQPSALGSQPPAFGQQGSAFGQPSQPGRPATSFGQPNTTFGQPSAPAPAFGVPSNPTSAFRQSSTSQPTFGQPSFGQISAPSASGQNLTTPAFRAPSAPGSNQQTGFGQAPASQQSAFGRQSSGAPQVSAFGNSSTAPTSAFGQPSQPTTTSASGQTIPAVANPFGRTSANQPVPAFGQHNASVNPSGNLPSQPKSAPVQITLQPPGGFGVASTPSNDTTMGQPSNTPAVSGRARVPTARDAEGKLKTWNGSPVTYVDNEPCTKGRDGAWEKVCFPDGPPSLTKAAELPDEAYDDSIKESYMFMKMNGFYKDGIIPSLPPKREWCSWDF